MKFYPPVFGYKPSFDCDKGDKHKMEVHYFVKANEDGNIGDAIPQPVGVETRNNPAPTIKNQLKTQQIEVRKCKTTEVDETLHTVEMFLFKRSTSNMSWSVAIYIFSNCLGNTAQMHLQKVKDSEMRRISQNTKVGFEQLM